MSEKPTNEKADTWKVYMISLIHRKCDFTNTFHQKKDSNVIGKLKIIQFKENNEMKW